jgi:hypothetical protein
MEALWGDENPAPAPQPKPAVKKQTQVSHTKDECVYYGHTWRVIGMLGEKQCITCGLKVYCPLCTRQPLKNAKPSYCALHAQKDQEI